MVIGDDPGRPREPTPLPQHRVRRINVIRPRRGDPRSSRRRRYRYWRKHTPHYYIVMTALSAAGAVCGLETAAFLSKSLLLSEIAFAAVMPTALVIFTAFFWGFFMVMNGNIPAHRIKYFLPHGAVGTLSPLLYTINISIALDGLGRAPVNAWALACSAVCCLLLCLQFSMGKAVVYRPPLHIVPKDDSAR